ncbi:UDP-2-acetamido-3-amino-2,3-dideoxy-glucuronate N-acetyltransferase [Alkalibacillus filiformis]|uniref:UDP-2-acetamido-3-amino-2,3-dideoxy-glucuronate N-acetyltransferase n=1 Tax=Alkalibacillus filiformis TaxID=200990 RepID=A0ABU0DWC8_9BACI|nr:acyltransferase [Alkalibacillus filiformis]MDQ0352762.1 UDP-2-acetamido-3-amino-2,3-dideoxy-glucuronate N-acetyltransferase [Alkalibacillus filiformis]
MSYYIHKTSYIDEGATIGTNSKVWHFSHVMPYAQIGNNCNLGQNVFIGKNVKIGNGVKIQNNVSVYEGVELEDYVFCGPSMVFTNDINPRAAFPKDINQGYLKTKVGYGASIGANATIVCGNTLGKWSFIAAGAVVNHDVPDYAIMVGVPAKQIGWMCKCGHKINTYYACYQCGRTYELTKNILIAKDEV